MEASLRIMDNIKMNRQLGTKWFTFYTKVRPWTSCLFAIPIVVDFIQYREIYISYWWMMVYFLAALAQPILCIIVFIKSRGDYEGFVHFVNGVLWFETVNMAYAQAVKHYIQNELNIGASLVIGAIIFLLGYLIWYRLNIKYFKKRLLAVTSDYLSNEINTNQFVNQSETLTVDIDEIRFCRKCGEKLINNSRFCHKCGIEIHNNSRSEKQ